MNESLRQAMLRARLREDDVAVHLGVDPKTVRRWLSGRVPYPSSRAALADLLGADEAHLWPEAGGPLSGRSRPEELAAVYPHRWMIPRAVWRRFFESAAHEIGILDYTAFFLAEIPGLLGLLNARARNGVQIRIVLRDPDSQPATLGSQGDYINQPEPGRTRGALALYRPMTKVEGVEIRLHRSVLYNSIYRADDQLLVNQHIYGTPAENSPVFALRGSAATDIVATYRNSFELIWAGATRLLPSLMRNQSPSSSTSPLWTSGRHAIQ